MAKVVVRVEAPVGEAEAANDALWQFAPQAVSEQEAGVSVVLVAGYPDEATAVEAHRTVASRWRAALEHEPDLDWVDNWRASEPAHRVGPFNLRLPEHPVSAGGLDLVIEPGATFGFSHPTTILCLELLSQLDLGDATVADIGCGSGVLSIAAALLGATSVHAVDIDAGAVRQTAANATDLGLDGVVAREGTAATLDGTVDVVVANMLAPALLDSAPAMLAALAPGGVMVLSGFLRHDVQRIASAFVPLLVAERRRDGDWAAVTLVSAGRRDEGGCPPDQTMERRLFR